ncbi:MAG TPA: PAN domain-containing protein [Pyrinomonadaceae bacterium]|nr:PAN domain-containing protein [Pyrinomonadaceae bacterium]
MKTCPACGRHYEDDTLVFCLQDGSRLNSTSDADTNATLVIPPAAATQPGPTGFSPPATPAQSTITGRPEQFHFPGRQTASESATERPRRSPLPWILAIVFVVGLFGVVIAWIVTNGNRDTPSGNSSPTPRPTASVVSSTPQATPDPTPMFSQIDNMTLEGSRITYYPRPSFALCEADCVKNSNCQAFTWIRPGAYNAADPGMCYLMASVTGRSPHTCCISAIRN